MLWFIVVPGEMLVAFFLSPPKFRLRLSLIFGISLIFLCLMINGFGTGSLLLLFGAFISFFLTIIVFKTGPIGQWLAVIEQFFLAFVYYKLLNFSRGSETLALESSGITQALLFVSVFSFLTHGLVLYFSAFRNKEDKRGRKEFIIFAAAAPVLLLIALLLPPDFVKHSVVFNPIDEDLPQTLNDNYQGGKRWPSDKQGAGEEGKEGETGDREGKLQGIPSDQWGSGQTGRTDSREGRTGSGQGGRQYAVMVVASPVNPVYAAENYYSGLDPTLGFIRVKKDEDFYTMPYQRFLETWQDPDVPNDRGRQTVGAFVLSTIPERVVPYRPFSIEPTVLNPAYHPFDYSYNVVSLLSVTTLEDWKKARYLRESEKQEYADYLALPLSPEDRSEFEDYLQNYVEDSPENDGSPVGFIMAMLRGFSTFQYELGFDDRVEVEQLKIFLTDVKTGDCSEFSNTAALLGRFAGVPSRVVTGYLAARELQTGAHRRGLMELEKHIPKLLEFPPENLYLVTTSHRHSWTQFYLPPYGWVDFETTSFAIPPPPGFDPNNRDVVIPLIQDYRAPEDVFVFPWGLVLRILGGAAGLTLAGLYLFRYGKRFVLAIKGRKNTRNGAGALYRLALMKIAAGGLPVKKPSQTALEFAETLPAFSAFAGAYTQILYRTRFGEGEEDALWKELREQYKAARRLKGPGFYNLIRKPFSLRGLYL